MFSHIKRIGLEEIPYGSNLSTIFTIAGDKYSPGISISTLKASYSGDSNSIILEYSLSFSIN